MTKKKKTLYEILEISPSASLPEIRAAHQRLSRELVSGMSGMSREDIDFKLKVIDVAFQTLSVDRTREAYDTQLATRNAPANVAAPRNVVALQPNVDAVSLKADAMSFKADAMSLKADAMSLKADAMSLRITAAPPKADGGHQATLKNIHSIFASLAQPLRKILIVVVSFVAVTMAIQAAFMLLVNRQAGHATAEVSKAEEKVMLQEYYQTYGVRPGSKIEADLLEVEIRRKENEQREAALKKQRQEEDERQFVEDSRRMGDQVTENLLREEERARDEEREKQQQLAEDKRNQEEAERYRIEEERRYVENERHKLGLN